MMHIHIHTGRGAMCMCVDYNLPLYTHTLTPLHSRWWLMGTWVWQSWWGGSRHTLSWWLWRRPPCSRHCSRASHQFHCTNAHDKVGWAILRDNNSCPQAALLHDKIQVTRLNSAQCRQMQNHTLGHRQIHRRETPIQNSERHRSSKDIKH